MAFTVKSRRARSSSSVSANATTARRPSVATSRRNVVISYMTLLLPKTPKVPCSGPKGTVRPKRRRISVGVARVAKSQSSRGSVPWSESRTAPPTVHVS